jgi:phosphatidylinositol phospholipase C, delta
VIYIADGKYKTLHMVAFTSDVFHMWNTTLRQLHSLRQDLMSGLGNMERRQMVWEKQYWKDADQSGDQKLSFEEIEQMCRRLNINSPRLDLLNRFMVCQCFSLLYWESYDFRQVCFGSQEADVQSRGYLDFTDFRRFVTLLKSRPDISDIYAMAKGSNDEFTFEVFENFMRNTQRVSPCQLHV